jgi:MFS family permease
MPDNTLVTQVTDDPYASIRIPEFRNLIIGRFTFIFSLRMMSTLVLWWVFDLTRDPFASGLVGLSEFVPAFGFALYAGHVIDKSERRNLMLKGVFSYVILAMLLLLLSTHIAGDRLSNQGITLCIYAIIFFTGVARAFTGPNFSSLLAMVVPRQYLQNATTWNQGSWLAASVSGHATSGFLIWIFGITGTLIIICSILVIAFVVLTRLKPKPPVLQAAEEKTWIRMKEGLRFVFSTKEILASFSLDMFAVLFGGAVAMVPYYARVILKVGPIGLGWLNAAIDIGAIISVVLLTLRPMRKAQGRKLLFAVAGFGTCIIIFALSKSFILSFVAMLVAGMLDGISVVVRGTVMQLKTPDHMRGRVSSVGSMFINSSNELGQFESGLASRLMGPIPSVAFGGCMTLLVVIVTWFKAPGLRKFQY